MYEFSPFSRSFSSDSNPSMWTRAVNTSPRLGERRREPARRATNSWTTMIESNASRNCQLDTQHTGLGADNTLLLWMMSWENLQAHYTCAQGACVLAGRPNIFGGQNAPPDILPHGTISPGDFASCKQCKRSLPPSAQNVPPHPSCRAAHARGSDGTVVCIGIMTACLGLEKNSQKGSGNETSPGGRLEGWTSTP